MNLGDMAAPVVQDGVVSRTAHSRPSELVGADLLDLPRTATITAAELDSAVSALTDSVGLYAGSATDDHGRVRIRELRRMLLLLGLIREESTSSGTLRVAPALLTRSARCLDLAGDACTDRRRSAALHREATALRSRRLG